MLRLSRRGALAPRVARARRFTGVSCACAILTLIFALCSGSCARGTDGFDGSLRQDAATIVSTSVGCVSDAAIGSAPSVAFVDASMSAALPVLSSDDSSEEEGGSVEDSGSEDADGVGDARPVDPAEGSLASEPRTGDLAITEVMLSPSGPEPESEWFEVYNLSASPKLLSGLTIQDGLSDVRVIAGTPAVVVPPDAYAVLVRDEATAVASLIPPGSIVYAYGTGVTSNEGIELDDGSAGDLTLWNGSTLLAEVPYGQWDASFVGQSIELAAPQLPEGDPASWCLAQTPWASGADDGTPGAPNDCVP